MNPVITQISEPDDSHIIQQTNLKLDDTSSENVILVDQRIIHVPQIINPDLDSQTKA